MSAIILTLVWLALLTNVFLVVGVLLNAHANKGWTNLFEVFLFVGTLFTVFIIGVVAFTGQFIIK